MRYESFLWIALLLTQSFAQSAPLASPPSSGVNGYPMLDANRVYSLGQQVKVDEPHGVYTGLMQMDNAYFLHLATVTETERRQESGSVSRGPFTVSGALSADVRRAISSSWEKMYFAYDCENRDVSAARTELARSSDGKDFTVGDHGSVCSLKPLSVGQAQAILNSHVFVEPWQTLFRDSIAVNAGRAVQYNFTFESGTRLSAQFQVEGGLNDKIQVYLMDLANYEQYSAHRPFRSYAGVSRSVSTIAKYEFNIRKDGVYYIVLDNGKAWLMPRNVTLHLDAILPKSTPASEQLRAFLEGLYSKLKQVFIFTDFRTTVRHCGVVNAFSNPNITLCVELLEELHAKGVDSATAFVYAHELGHTLMREWGLPLWDNEDAADEFATAFLLMAKQQQIALQAAQWWASQGATSQDAMAKIWMDDRHSLSPQRARNIIRWVNNTNDLVPRWQHILIPNMQTASLQSMLRDPEVSEKDFIKSELSRRGASAGK